MNTKDDLGYTTIRVTKKAHRVLAREAIANKRPIWGQFDIIMGITD